LVVLVVLASHYGEQVTAVAVEAVELVRQDLEAVALAQEMPLPVTVLTELVAVVAVATNQFQPGQEERVATGELSCDTGSEHE
jgi:hypothetical protein